MDIITRKQALEQGLAHFFTGKPCCRGHLEPRLVATKQCIACKRIWSQEYAARKPFDHKLRVGFRLACAHCGKEVVLAGIPKGYLDAPFCRIADSYKDRVYCGKSCQDRHFYRRADIKQRCKHRYNSDPVYRQKLLAAQAAMRKSETYKQKQSSYHRNWRSLNKESRAAYQLEWERQKRSNDLNHRLKSCLRHRVQQAVKHGYKSASTLELIGCSIDQLRDHLEAQFLPGMSWANWTHDGWHIDHIRPCATFDLTDPVEQRRCFHYTNLQPLWAADNCAKRDSLDWRPKRYCTTDEPQGALITLIPLAAS
jgi:hypothetical protein